MKVIQLSKGLVTFVDDEDYAELIKYTWHAVTGYNGTHYASRFDYSGDVRVSIKMHRYIMNVDDPDILIDHDDGNGLNNQKTNLKYSNKSLNAINSSRVKNATGIQYDRTRKRYKAFLLRPKRYVGTYLTYEEALAAIAIRKSECCT